MIRKIGFVGLGAMGLPMASNLLAGGFEVRGFDLAPEARAKLARAAGTAAQSAADAAVAQKKWSRFADGAAARRAAEAEHAAAAAAPRRSLRLPRRTLPIKPEYCATNR